MKAIVAYEAARRPSRKDAVKPLKWHRGKNHLFAKGQKGEYRITEQKPNRRVGVFKWCLTHDGKPALLNGQPMSLDDREELKKAAAAYDELPQGTPVTIVASEEAKRFIDDYERMGRQLAHHQIRAENGFYMGHDQAVVFFKRVHGLTTDQAEAAATAYDQVWHGARAASEGSAREAPTREEWEVIVTNPPAAHRGAILAMGLGETQEVGNKIILRGFHDDEQAGRVASAIARTYKVGVTFGPRNALYEAAEGMGAREARRPPGELDEHAATELELYADNTAEIYRQKEAILANLKKRLAKGTYKAELAQKIWMYWVDAAAKRYVKEFGGGVWNEVFPIDVRREVARREEEKERVEMQLQGRPVMREDTGRATAHDSSCGCKPFTDVTTDQEAFQVCAARAERIGLLKTPRAIYDLVAPAIVSKPYEEFYVLGIGAHGEFEGKLMAFAKVAQGGQHKVEVEIERIAQVLLGTRPDVYVLAHNHPSGDATPSSQDEALTKKIREGVAKVLPKCVWGDHVVIAATEFYSMAEDKKHKV